MLIRKSITKPCHIIVHQFARITPSSSSVATISCRSTRRPVAFDVNTETPEECFWRFLWCPNPAEDAAIERYLEAFTWRLTETFKLPPLAISGQVSASCKSGRCCVTRAFAAWKPKLVGTIWKICSSNWKSSPNFGVKKKNIRKYLKPPPRKSSSEVEEVQISERHPSKPRSVGLVFTLGKGLHNWPQL